MSEGKYIRVLQRLNARRQRWGKKEGGPLNRFTTVKCGPPGPLNAAWERNGPSLAITDTAKMMGDTTFHNGTVQRTNFRLIHSHCVVTELLQIA
jgi:hypothetical protein